MGNPIKVLRIDRGEEYNLQEFSNFVKCMASRDNLQQLTHLNKTVSMSGKITLS
jgi:hypothetical protein